MQSKRHGYGVSLARIARTLTEALSGHKHAFVSPDIHLFILDRPPQPVDEDVVQVPSFADHAGVNTVAGELSALGPDASTTRYSIHEFSLMTIRSPGGKKLGHREPAILSMPPGCTMYGQD